MINIEKTNKSPQVFISEEDGVAIFKGRSIHSDGFDFYDPIIKWFEKYSKTTIKVDFAFDHINTITNKCILQILLILHKKSKSGLEYNVAWFYDEDDDDMLETGEELELLSEVKFDYKIIEE